MQVKGTKSNSGKKGNLITEKELIEHFIDNPKDFIESCLFIIDKDRHKVPFILNPLQLDYYNKRSPMDIILKARKQGYSSVISALLLHKCAFVKNTRAVIISHEKKATERLLDRVKYYIKTSEFPIRTEKYSESEISFPDTNSTFYIGTAGAKAFGRGDDITDAHLSEHCFYENPDIITSVKEAGTNNMQIVLESTANGAGNHSHSLWLRAIKKETDYKPNFYAWWQSEEYCLKGILPFSLDEREKKLQSRFNLSYGQLAWRRKKLREMDKPELFVQEYPSSWEEAFITSGSMVFDAEALQEQEDNLRPIKWAGDLAQDLKKVKLIPEKEGALKIWQSPKETGAYLITSDSSMGVKGGDYAVADVWDLETWEQVAQYRCHINPDDFGDILQLLGIHYNYAVLMPETNVPGNSTYDRLVQLIYPKLWLDPKDFKPFRTTSRTRALVVAAAIKCVGDKSVKINSEDTINECRTYVISKTRKYGAASNCNDDCVITLSLGCYVLISMSLNRYIGISKAKPLTSPDNIFKIINKENYARKGYKTKQIV
jgi:hypothetical protein